MPTKFIPDGRMFEIIAEVAQPLRKGPAVTERGNVTEIYDMDPESAVQESDGTRKVDCHFFVAAIDVELAERYRDDIALWLRDFPDQSLLLGSPSFVHMGHHMEQQAALLLFAIGHALGFWKLVIPADLGITGHAAEIMAGNGMIYATEYSVDRLARKEG